MADLPEDHLSPNAAGFFPGVHSDGAGDDADLRHHRRDDQRRPRVPYGSADHPDPGGDGRVVAVRLRLLSRRPLWTHFTSGIDGPIANFQMVPTVQLKQTPMAKSAIETRARPDEGVEWHGWVYKLKHGVYLLFDHAFCLSVAAGCLFPLVWMVSSSLKTQSTIFSDMRIWVAHPHWGNYYEAWTRGHFGQFFFNSLFYTLSVVVGVVLIASLAAYAFSRLKFPGRNILFILLISTMMIPIPGSFIALYVLLQKIGLYNSRLGYILPQVNGGLAPGVFLLKTFFGKLPPGLEDGARSDRCKKFPVYLNFPLPLAKPALAVLVVFNALAVWNEYLLAMLVLSDQSLMPLQRGLMVFQGAHLTQYPLLMAGIAISIAPISTLYFLMQRYIVAGITAGALKM